MYEPCTTREPLWPSRTTRPCLRISFGASSSGGAPLPPPGLLDTRLVRAELTRLRLARPGPGNVGLARARIARSQGTSDGGSVR